MCIAVGGPKHRVDKYLKKLDERIIEYGLILGKKQTNDPTEPYKELCRARITSQKDTRLFYAEQKKLEKLGYETITVRTKIKGKLESDDILELRLVKYYSWDTPKGTSSLHLY